MKTKLALATTSLGLTASLNAAVVTFDDNPLAADSYFDPQASTTFSSGGVSFQHAWNYGCCWGNFTYSNRTDTTTAGYTNDRSAITGGGASGSSNYGISYNVGAWIDFGQATLLGTIDVTNTTYAYLSMLNGDSFAKQFEAGDYFRVTVNGLDASGNTIGGVQFSLAEGTNILNSWLSVDLASLGTVHGVSFNYSSTDIGTYGINTPTYFAIDNINYQTVPVPAAAWLFLSAISATFAVRASKQCNG